MRWNKRPSPQNAMAGLSEALYPVKTCYAEVQMTYRFYPPRAQDAAKTFSWTLPGMGNPGEAKPSDSGISKTAVIKQFRQCSNDLTLFAYTFLDNQDLIVLLAWFLLLTQRQL